MVLRGRAYGYIPIGMVIAILLVMLFHAASHTGPARAHVAAHREATAQATAHREATAQALQDAADAEATTTAQAGTNCMSACGGPVVPGSWSPPATPTVVPDKGSSAGGNSIPPTTYQNGAPVPAGWTGNTATAPRTATHDASAPASWSATGNMTMPRENYTATLLPNGKVLVVGGSTPSRESTASAEVYDPSTGTWTATGSMSASRNGHTATLLRNGQVLVAGGEGLLGERLATAELYDPQTGKWSPTGSMSTPRAFHTATLLRDGQVLVAGGLGRDGILSSAELYDPNAGTWTSASNMLAFRLGHTATLLQNGKVLVAGNQINLVGAASAELYDPNTNSWTVTGSMHVDRYGHTATLLPTGRVLVAGGGTGTGTQTAELYDPGTGAWSLTGSMTYPRFDFTATLLKTGQVLVAGGADASAEIYDPLTGLWSTVGSMASLRQGFTATLLNSGQVLVAGGLDPNAGSSSRLASGELYTPAPRPPVTFSSNSMAFGSGSISFGNLPIGVPSASVAVTIANSSPTALTISTVAITGSTPLDYSVAGTCAGKTLVPGARCLIAVRFTPSAVGVRHARALVTDNAPSSPQSIELGGRGLPVSGPNTWKLTGALRLARWDHTATLLRDGQVLVVGGMVVSPFLPLVKLVGRTAERYDPRTGRWTRTANLSAPRFGHTMTLLPDGDVLVAGGVDAASSAELFNPRHGTWAAAADMRVGRYGHGAVLLRSGKVLVAGGCCDSWTDGNGRSYGVPLSSAEVYDPRNHRWNRAGDMVLKAEGTTLVLLPSGKVLAVGTTFDTPFNEHDTAWELYDPATGLWSHAAALSRARHSPGTVTLLRDGRVLVAGGTDADGITNHADLYDPRTNSWLPTGSMTTARTNHTVTLLPSGQVLVVGGCLPTCNKPLASAEVYNPRTGTWTPVGNLHVARSHHTATLLPNGQVLVSGGFGDNGIPLASAELYTSLALQVAPMTALVNQAVTVTGVNFSPQEVVSLYWNNPGTHLLATVTTGEDGSFVVRLRLPQDRRGRHLIYAVGRCSQAPVSVTVAVH